MRLFVALTPPQAALDELERAVAPLRRRWPGLSWTGQDRWHVTLAFLGETGEARLDDLRARLERAARRRPVGPLRIGRGGAFPSPARARVLVAHIDGGQPELAALSALAASVAAGARRAGAPPPDEGRRYRPHLTLARSRQPAHLGELVEALDGALDGAGLGQPDRRQAWTPPEMHLIRSQLGPRPAYHTIDTWPLGRAAGRSDVGVQDLGGARDVLD